MPLLLTLAYLGHKSMAFLPNNLFNSNAPFWVTGTIDALIVFEILIASLIVRSFYINIISLDKITLRTELDKAELQSKSESEEALVQLMMATQSERRNFLIFVQEMQKAFQELEEAVGTPKPRVDTLFRRMHSIKGTCAAFHLTHVSRQAHYFENQLGELRLGGGKLEELLPTLKTGFKALQDEFESFLKKHNVCL